MCTAVMNVPWLICPYKACSYDSGSACAVSIAGFATVYGEFSVSVWTGSPDAMPGKRNGSIPAWN